LRTAFIEELVLLARSHPKIFLVVGDLGYSVVERFAQEFPDRFLNAGVAEQNMTGLAAGLASEGFHVFTYSIGNFPTFRCAEQIRNDIAYHNLRVTVVAVGGGVAYGNLGYSHHTVQDYALMRSFPHMLIAAPGDPMEVRACLRFLVAHPQPSYFRLGKAGEPVFHASVPQVTPGVWLGVRSGNPRQVLLATGGALGVACRWAQTRPFEGYAVCSLPLWGMDHKAGQAEQVGGCDQVVALEDHFPDGGFGSWLLESLGQSRELRSRVSIHGLEPGGIYGRVCSQDNLMAVGGLD